MRKNRFAYWIGGCAAAAILCFGQAADAAGQLYQVSLLNGLMQGYYEGSTTVGELLSHGDIGIGTFDALDGEMIVLDGVVYKAQVDGQVAVQPPREGVAFAAVAKFQPSFTLNVLPKDCGIETLKTALDVAIAQQNGSNFNVFYVVRIDGTFDLAHVRSVGEQTAPYRPLAEVAQDQKEYEYRHLKGTIVAVRCPNFADGMNLSSWHFHFISEDRAKGGHLLDVRIRKAHAAFDVLDDWRVLLPQTDRFAALDLAKDLSEETKRVEAKRP